MKDFNFREYALWCQKHYLDIIGTGWNKHPKTMNAVSCLYLAYSYIYYEYEGFIKNMGTIKATEICLNAFEYVYHVYVLLFPQIQFLFNQLSRFNDYTAKELHLSANDYLITKDLYNIVSEFEKNYELLDSGILKKDLADIMEELNEKFDNYLDNTYVYFIGTPKKDFVVDLMKVQKMLQNGLIE